MAAAGAGAGRKQVRQEELRRLMREKQRQNAGKKRIDSPFAKYNSLGHLSCSLCNAPVKGELLWQTHVLGKQHREKVAELKGTKQTATGSAAGTSSHSVKRKTVETENTDLKRVKGTDEKPHTSSSGLPADFFDEAEQESASVQLSKRPGPSLLSGNYDDDDDDEEEEQEQSSKSSVVHKTEIPPPTQEVIANSLPADFFDTRTPAAPIVSHSGSIQKAEIQEKVIERKENTAEALPEGFFDDPEVDAKVRKVDAPKDQMDKEWDEFQKAMRQVNTISEAIVAEDDEEGRLDRQIGEIDEQIECYRRVELLRNRQDEMKEKLKEAMKLKAAQEKEEEDVGSEDEEELQDLLSQDWRVKGALL
ncbi:Zinc finger protein 830 [Lonchura striata]|uniref:Zinc finger protein 830 n=1 Tax=Lonchura striata TaxID=40157 RepID=A0A218VAJ8_9PASE|nr:zinc finger protein 830 [Lonchura striata domestica]OWK62959.1 Zinc finger protein 830 [Lonchura striata domestica]